MKCQKCGKNEVNFHYSSNVNGCVTETHLCSDCAAESGYDIGKILELRQLNDLGTLFETVFPMQNTISGFMPMAIPMVQTGTNLPFTMQPRVGMIDRGNSCGCGCETQSLKDTKVEVDEVMSRRRELNMQMRSAVEKEEFEKAAELRDKIKELENHSTSDKELNTDNK